MIGQTTGKRTRPTAACLRGAAVFAQLALGRALRSAGLAVAVLLAGATVATADTVVVTADTALAWNRPSGDSFVVAQLAKNTKLDVVRRTGEWYEVVLPEPRDGAVTGFIRITQVAIDSIGAMSDAARRAATATSGSNTIRMRPGFINLDIGGRRGVDLVRTSRAFGDRYPENGSITANYGDGAGYQIDAMGSQAVWGRIALGLGVSYYRRRAHTTVSATIPHPIVANRPRAVAFETTSPEGTELAVHVPLVWIPVSSTRVKILFFGGPSVFRLSQDIVTDVRVNDQPPYDAPSVDGPGTTRMQGTDFGFLVGGDVGYFFSRSVGVGIGARYSRATAALSHDAATLEGVAGAAEIVAGLRFRF